MLDEIMRLRYMYAWAMPYFFILILTGQSFNPVLFLAMTLIAISLNIHNDICDKDYRGYAKRHLWLMTIFSFAGGIVIYPHYLLVLWSVVVFSHNLGLKKIPIITTVADTSYTLIPALLVGVSDPLLLLTLFLIGFGGEGIHELSDGEAMTKVRGGSYLVGGVLITATILLAYIVWPINQILIIFAGGTIAAAFLTFIFGNKFKYKRKIHPREENSWSAINNMGLIIIVAFYIISGGTFFL